MVESEQASGQPASGGAYQLGAWDDGGTVELTATGADATEVVNAALAGVLAAARSDEATTSPTGDAANSSASIRGQGTTVAAVFAELAADLLAQLDANGKGMNQVRLDGLLATEDGFTAWGYLVGTASTNPPPIGLALDDDPVVTETAGQMTLRCRLRRGA